jgi:hypothetical protein
LTRTFLARECGQGLATLTTFFCSSRLWRAFDAHIPDEGVWTGAGNQGFGSGSDPYSIGPVDPDPDSESRSGSRRAKMNHKSRKNSCFEVLDGLFCELQASSVTWTYFVEA